MGNSFFTSLILQGLFFGLVLAKPSTEVASLEHSNGTELADMQARGDYFYIAATLLSYDDSVALCLSLGGRLVNSLNPVEVTALALYLIGINSSCLGLPFWVLLRLNAVIPVGNQCTATVVSLQVLLLGVSPATSLRSCICIISG